VSSAYLPWLQVKNLLPAIAILLAYSIAAHRSGSTRRTLAAAWFVGAGSWALLLAYNVFYFGHALGLPEPFPRLSNTGVEYTLGLLFDRNQGMFVQVPFAIVGVLGLWLARKKFPIAVLATVGSVGIILILNGTYIANPYGGLSFAGRFMWTLMPIMIVWSAFVLARWQEAGRLLWAPVIVVCAAWLYQAEPILAGDHTYYNVPPPWDPASWPGWWPGFSSILPQFDLAGRPFGAPAFALFIELAIAAVVAIAAYQYMRPGVFSRSSTIAIGALGLLILVTLFVAKPLSPNSALRYEANQLGAPVSGGDQPGNSPDVTLQGVLPGTYKFTLSYFLSGPVASASLMVSCNSTSGAAPQSVIANLDPGHLIKSVKIECRRSGTVSSQLSVAAHSELNVGSLWLQKVAV
jgi:hypothetical protein